MYEFIRGRIQELRGTMAILRSGGMGYRVDTPLSTCSRLRAGTRAELFVSLQERECRARLFGFITRQERDLFEEMLAVVGVGPLVALRILSALSIGQVRDAIARKDPSAMILVEGVGQKTAQRVVESLWGNSSDKRGWTRGAGPCP